MSLPVASIRIRTESNPNNHSRKPATLSVESVFNGFVNITTNEKAVDRSTDGSPQNQFFFITFGSPKETTNIATIATVLSRQDPPNRTKP
jgi:hypothetical protein